MMPIDGWHAAVSRRLRARLPLVYLGLRKLFYLGREERLDPLWAGIARALSPGELAVQAGPFAGMRYLPAASGSGLLPKIVGCYEMELHPAVADSISRAPVRLINIGAAEGYYAVGYALRIPRLEVHAFDTDVLARDRLRRLARHNGTARRIHVGGRCSHAALARLIVPGTLIVCDCEGGEGRLLDPGRVPGLAAADILVEIHVEQDRSIAAALLGRFAGTHRPVRVEITDRVGVFAHVLSRLTPGERAVAVYEREEQTEWLWLRSHSWRAV